MNFLYVVGASDLSRWQNNELRYSLRSIDPLDIGWIGIAGPQVPAFLYGLHHVFADPHDEDRYNRTKRQILAACDSNAPEELILMNDDFIVKNPLACPWQPCHLGLVQSRGLGVWRKSVVDTGTWLKSRGIAEPLNYEGHTPFPFLKSKAKPILEDLLRQKEILQFRTAYGNLVGIGGTLQPNAKRNDPSRVPPDSHYWSLKNEPTDKARGYLETHWPKPSRWEV